MGGSTKCFSIENEGFRVRGEVTIGGRDHPSRASVGTGGLSVDPMTNFPDTEGRRKENEFRFFESVGEMGQVSTLKD